FLSGDRHLAEVCRLPADHPDGVGYPLFDVTSSSLNVPSGNFTKAKVRFANEVNSYRVGLTYFDVNFGEVAIDWGAADPVIRLRVRDEKGGVVLQQRLKLSELQPSTPRPGGACRPRRRDAIAVFATCRPATVVGRRHRRDARSRGRSPVNPRSPLPHDD